MVSAVLVWFVRLIAAAENR